MVMTDDEILREAARIRSRRRRRLTQTCEVCGTRFEGVVQRRFCSDRCRVQAMRVRSGQATPRNAGTLPDAGQSPFDVQERLAAIDRLVQRRDAIFHGRPLPDDSVDILRRERELRGRRGAS